MSKKQESVFNNPTPGRVNIWVKRAVKAIIKAKMDKDPHFNFSEYVEGLIIEKESHNGWVDVMDDLPKPLQTVWLTNGKGWCCLGCRVVSDGGWHWAQSNGVIYIENGEIVSECESEDLEVNYWHELPKPPYT